MGKKKKKKRKKRDKWGQFLPFLSDQERCPLCNRRALPTECKRCGVDLEPPKED